MNSYYRSLFPDYPEIFHCENEQWAYFYHGRFPHEYTKIFRDVDNDIVEVSNTLSEEDKVRLLAVISFLFIARIHNN